ARLRGRRDELVVASGGNLYPLMFANNLRAVSGLGSDSRVVVLLGSARGNMEINVETTRSDTAQPPSEIQREISDQYPDLAKNQALGIFELRITFREPGELRNGGRKLKRLVDKRHFAPAEHPAPTQKTLQPEESLA